MEIWAKAKGYEGFYEVSNIGRIRSLHSSCKKIISTSGKRYLKFSAYKYGKFKNIEIHRIVALTFIPNLENKTQVNHKNGVKNDNRVENLEWCTHSENAEHAKNNNLLKPPKGKNHGNSKWVLNLETGIFYESVTDACKTISISKATMSQYLNGYFKKSIPFIFV